MHMDCEWRSHLTAPRTGFVRGSSYEIKKELPLLVAQSETYYWALAHCGNLSNWRWNSRK